MSEEPTLILIAVFNDVIMQMVYICAQKQITSRLFYSFSCWIFNHIYLSEVTSAFSVSLMTIMVVLFAKNPIGTLISATLLKKGCHVYNGQIAL